MGHGVTETIRFWVRAYWPTSLPVLAFLLADWADWWDGPLGRWLMVGYLVVATMIGAYCGMAVMRHRIIVGLAVVGR